MVISWAECAAALGVVLLMLKRVRRLRVMVLVVRAVVGTTAGSRKDTLDQLASGALLGRRSGSEG